MTQYIVAYFEDGTLNVSAIGPFRSLNRAIRARDALDARESSGEVLFGSLPQTVQLRGNA